MQNWAKASTAVIWLWAEARLNLIQDLRERASERGLNLNPDWTLTDAVAGFFSPDDISDLFELAKAQSEEYISQSEYMLAALWLSTAMFSDESRESMGTRSQDVENLSTTGDFPEHIQGREISLQGLLEVSQKLTEALEGVFLATTRIAETQETLNAAINSSDISMVEELSTVIRELIADSSNKKKWLRQTVQTAFEIVCVVYASEEDLDPDGKIVYDLESSLNSPRGHIEELAEEVKGHVEAIIEYKEHKTLLINQILDTTTRINSLTTELDILSADENAQSRIISETAEDALTPMGLNILQETLSQAENQLAELNSRVARVRQNLAHEIGETAQQLIVEEVPSDTVVLGQVELYSLQQPETLLIHDSIHLSEIAQELRRIRDTHAQERKLDSSELAGELIQDWSKDAFQQLLEQLATERRDPEVFLLLLTSAQSRDINEIELTPTIVESILRGIEVFAGPKDQFETFNLLAPLVWQYWSVKDSVSQAKICLLFLGADCTRACRLPENFLWNLNISEWPLLGMPTWHQLWTAALSEQALPLVIEEDLLLDELRNAGRAAEQSLGWNGRTFASIHSVKSKRHAHFLAEHVLPGFVERLDELKEIQAAASKGGNTHHLKRISEILAELDDKTVIADLQRGLAEEGIDDSNPFHHRKSVDLVSGVVKAIRAYTSALDSYVKALGAGERGFLKDSLLDELSKYPEIEHLGVRVAESLALNSSSELEHLSYEKASIDGTSHLTEQLLTKPIFALRNARLVAHIVNQQTTLEWWLPPLLEDLYLPLEASAAAQYLIAQQAPNQALLLTEHLDIEGQKCAQELRDQLRRQTEAKENELLGLGGEIEDLRQARDLGRWAAVLTALDERYISLRQQKEAEEQARDAEIDRLFGRLRDLDELVSDLRNQMPREAWALLNDSLDAARQCVREATHTSEVKEFLSELEYRIQHQSWAISDLQASYSEFVTGLAGTDTIHSDGLTAEEVLEHLENAEIDYLGIQRDGPNSLADTQIATRIELLRNWIQLKSIRHSLSGGLSRKETGVIRGLYRYFAQMVAMKHGTDPRGEPLEYSDPLPVSVWRLTYPKTRVLDDDCLLAVLPGQLNPTIIKDFEDVLDEKGWLDRYGYGFVILFVPKCNESIYSRLTKDYQGRGLVLIDEPTLLRIVLAERDETNPVGLLRPIMLNSKPVENIDIFKVNQLVDQRASIFVGRDRLIQGLVTSGDNYAIFGGRRIGKSSVLNAVRERATRKGTEVLWFSFEGESDCRDNAIAARIADEIALPSSVRSTQDFKNALQDRLENNPDFQLLMLLDEIDRYIEANRSRHLLIETVRTLTESYPSRLRVIVSGFMRLYECLQGQGPYTPTSDPWQRMFNRELMKNLQATAAERIVKEGFREILGWNFESRSIPQRVVEMTGGHPAFVQKFCSLVQQRVGVRGDRTVRMSDLQAVFDDDNPDDSYIAFVKGTLGLNLNPIDRYLTIWLAATEGTSSFTVERLKKLMSEIGISIPEDYLDDSLDRLKATSVIIETTPGLYEFTVPDYPEILQRLGSTRQLSTLEEEVRSLVDD